MNVIKGLTLTKDRRCTFISLYSVFFQSGDVMRVGISRPSDHDISVVVENPRGNQFSSDGLSADVVHKYKDRSLRERLYEPDSSPGHGC